MRLGDYVAMRRKGFTLIELLVVVAIIIILAGILYPVFASTRRAAYNAACLSNLKQIGLAVQMYTQDYDECFPTACGMMDHDIHALVVPSPDPNVPAVLTPYLWQVVNPYIKNSGIWRCPGDVGFTVSSFRLDYRPNAYARLGSSYNYNHDLVWYATDPRGLGLTGYWAPLTVGAIQHPTDTWVAGEPAGHWHNSILAPPPPERTPENDTTNTYHENLVMVDGHAKSFTRAQIGSLADPRS
jgi:general secretion pathway protein G